MPENTHDTIEVIETPGGGDFHCPFCGRGHQVARYDRPHLEAGRHRVFCKNCGRPFVLVIWLVPEYSTDDRLELLDG